MPDNAKDTLRREMLRRRAALSFTEKQRISEGILQRLLEDPVFNNCKVVFLYASTKDEIATDKIAEYCLQSKKIVCMPRCTTKGVMEAYRVCALSDLVPGRYGIREPAEGGAFVPPDQIDLVLAPCLCADRRGYRLGYGGGYYDRFLKHTDATVIALCPAAHLLSVLPAEAHDYRCHRVATETEVVVTNEK